MEELSDDVRARVFLLLDRHDLTALWDVCSLYRTWLVRFFVAYCKDLSSGREREKVECIWDVREMWERGKEEGERGMCDEREEEVEGDRKRHWESEVFKRKSFRPIFPPLFHYVNRHVVRMEGGNAAHKIDSNPLYPSCSCWPDSCVQNSRCVCVQRNPRQILLSRAISLHPLSPSASAVPLTSSVSSPSFPSPSPTSPISSPSPSSLENILLMECSSECQCTRQQCVMTHTSPQVCVQVRRFISLTHTLRVSLSLFNSLAVIF